MAANVEYTNNDRGLNVEVTLYDEPDNGHAVVEVVDGQGVKIVSPDGTTFLFVKGDCAWSVSHNGGEFGLGRHSEPEESVETD